MKHLYLYTLLLLALLSCGNCQKAAKGPQHLTLMTYNVGVFGKYQENSTEGVAALIKQQGAQIVGLNETDSLTTRHYAYQVKELAQALGADWHYYFARAMAYQGGAYGNSVVTPSRIIHRYRIALPKGEGAEPRSVAVVETDACVFAATHLDHRSPVAALAQMKVINDWFDQVFKGSKKPVFLCGDFNVEPESDVIQLAKTRWTLLSGTANTYSSKNLRKCIDYIFAFKDAAPVTVESAQVLTEGTQDLSDHCPIVMTVRY